MSEVFIDVNEPKQVYSKLMKKTDVKFKRLVVGDVVAGQICIERKSVDDLISSLWSKRIFRQLHTMLANFDLPYLVIVGKLFPSVVITHTPQDHVDDFFDFCVKYARKLPVLRVDRRFYSDLVYRIISQKESESEMPIIKGNGRTKAMITEHVLCSLPGIGSVRARRILSHYKSIENFVLDKKDAIPGVSGLNVYREYFK